MISLVLSLLRQYKRIRQRHIRKVLCFAQNPVFRAISVSTKSNSKNHFALHQPQSFINSSHRQEIFIRQLVPHSVTLRARFLWFLWFSAFSNTSAYAKGVYGRFCVLRKIPWFAQYPVSTKSNSKNHFALHQPQSFISSSTKSKENFPGNQATVITKLS